MKAGKKSQPPSSAERETSARDSKSETGRAERSRKRSGRTTIRDVAEAAGVSIATVSFVMNDRPGQVISEPVRKRVLAVAKRLDYHPSAAAAGLARKRTNNVSLIFYKSEALLSNQLYSFVIQGAIREATSREYNILFSFLDAEYKGAPDLPKVIREKNAEGALLIQNVERHMIADLRSRGISTIAIDNHPSIPGLNSVYVDNAAGARMAVDHLVELGHQDIVFLRAFAERPSIAERSDGFREGMVAHGLPFRARANFVDAREICFEAAYDKTKSVLKKRPEITAMFCANDEMASGAIRAAHDVGRKVPEDLSIVGFDDVVMSTYLNPPLTTIGVQKEEMGRRAMARLLELVEGDDSVRRETIPVQLIVRGSTAPPKS